MSGISPGRSPSLRRRSGVSCRIFPSSLGTQSVGWRTHYPQTGDPRRPLRETVAATLHTSKAKLDATMLARKMSMLSLNWSDLGLQEEAFEVQVIVTELRRTGGDMLGLAGSLINLLADLSKLGRREEALVMVNKAVIPIQHSALVKQQGMESVCAIIGHGQQLRDIE